MKRLCSLYLALVVPLLISSGYIQANEGSYGVDNPCCNPCDNYCNDYYSCSNDQRYFIKLDALYWIAHQEGIDTFINGFTTQQVSTTYDSYTVNDSNILIPEKKSFSKYKANQQHQRFHFDWRGGYRLGLGYNFCEGWVAAADWTHYQGHAHGHQSPPNGCKYFPGVPEQWEDFGYSETVSESKNKTSGHWKLDYDVLDFTLNSPMYCAASCLSWNFFGGIKVAFIDQKIHLDYDYYSKSASKYPSSSDFSKQFSLEKEKYKTDFYAVGPEIGLNFGWNVGCGLSLYGNASGALVYAHFKNKLKSKLHSSSISASFPVETSSVSKSHYDAHSRNSDYVCRPVLDLGLGISWLKQFCYCDRETTVALKLGWEHHQWFDQDQLGNGGDLYLDGFTLSSTVFF